MSGSMNLAIIIGNLGADPEIRTTQDGRKIASLRVATSESWRDKATGERKERTEWHRVVCMSDGLAGVAEQYLRKGAKIAIQGKIQTREWEDQQGQKRFATEIVVGMNGSLTMLDGPSGGGNGRAAPVEPAGGRSASSGYGGLGRPDAATKRARDEAYASGEDLDDEIPF